MKVALSYDRINKWGGAESVLLALHEIFPRAPLYTSVYDKNRAPWASVFDIRPSFLQRLPLPKDKHEYYPFLMGFAFETFDFEVFDVVISVTHEFSKAIITKPDVLHICYCLTPVSYLWSSSNSYFNDKSDVFKTLSWPLIKYLRFYDRIVSKRPDLYVAISRTVQKRIRKYYGLKSKLVYPPVSIYPRFDSNPAQDDGYFLIVSRLVPNKRIDLAIKAFNKLGMPLKIVGTGRSEKHLKSISKQNIIFLGSLTSDDLQLYYRNCRAVVVPGVEDFGIVSVEAQSHGKPVFAYASGGSLETVIEGKTGWFFRSPTVESLVTLITNKKDQELETNDCINNAKKFSKQRFNAEFLKLVETEFFKFKSHV